MLLSKSIVFVICSVILHWSDADTKPSCTVIFMDATMSSVPLPYLNGYVNIKCTMFGIYMGLWLPNGTRFITDTSTAGGKISVQFSARLNTTLIQGNYTLDTSGTVGRTVITEIRYLLCDPSPVQLVKKCGYGHLCVMKGSTPKCETRISCSKTASDELFACNANNAENGKGVCNALASGKMPQFLDKSSSCDTKPVFKQMKERINFGTTTPIAGLANINLTVAHGQTGTSLSTVCTGRLLGNRKFILQAKDAQSSGAASPLGLQDYSSIIINSPERATVNCDITDNSREKQAEFFFYILFYDPSHNHLTLTQGDIKLDITKDPVDTPSRFDPKKPIQFTATTDEQLYIAVSVNRKLNLQYQENASHESSITFRYDPKRTTYSFIATVYFYELPPFGTVKVLTMIERKVKLDFGITVTCGTTGKNVGLIAGLIVMTIISIAGITSTIVMGVLWWKGRKKVNSNSEYDDRDQPTNDSLGSGGGT